MMIRRRGKESMGKTWRRKGGRAQVPVKGRGRGASFCLVRGRQGSRTCLRIWIWMEMEQTFRSIVRVSAFSSSHEHSADRTTCLFPCRSFSFFRRRDSFQVFPPLFSSLTTEPLPTLFPVSTSPLPISSATSTLFFPFLLHRLLQRLLQHNRPRPPSTPPPRPLTRPSERRCALLPLLRPTSSQPGRRHLPHRVLLWRRARSSRRAHHLRPSVRRELGGDGDRRSGGEEGGECGEVEGVLAEVEGGESGWE
jgi:hypothetical protein